jgi:hypothetical protein
MLVFEFFEATRDLWRMLSRIDLKALLEHSRACKSSHEHNRIYAFLGLADPGYEIMIDYRPQHKYEDLLVHTAKRIILTEGKLDIFSHVELDHSPLRGALPSWVPNWTSSRDQCKALLYVNARFKYFLYL